MERYQKMTPTEKQAFKKFVADSGMILNVATLTEYLKDYKKTKKQRTDKANERRRLTRPSRAGKNKLLTEEQKKHKAKKRKSRAGDKKTLESNKKRKSRVGDKKTLEYNKKRKSRAKNVFTKEISNIL